MDGNYVTGNFTSALVRLFTPPWPLKRCKHTSEQPMDVKYVTGTCSVRSMAVRCRVSFLTNLCKTLPTFRSCTRRRSCTLASAASPLVTRLLSPSCWACPFRATSVPHRHSPRGAKVRPRLLGAPLHGRIPAKRTGPAPDEARVHERGSACVEERGAQGEGEEGCGPVDQARTEEEGSDDLVE